MALKKINRTLVLRFRVTPTEKQQIEANAVASNFNELSDYLRLLGLASLRINADGKLTKRPSRGSFQSYDISENDVEYVESRRNADDEQQDNQKKAG